MPGQVHLVAKIDGTAVSAELQVQSADVRKEVNRIPAAKLIVVDGDPATGEFPASSSDQFIPGNELEILVRRDGGDEISLFKGIIVKQRIKVTGSGSSKLYVDARDVAFRSTLAPRYNLFEDMSDADILSEILSAHGLNVSVEGSDYTHQKMAQHNATDWDFTLSRARANGQLIFVDEGTVTIAPPEIGGGPVATLTYGSNVLSFDAEMDARTQIPSALAKIWRQADQAFEEFTGEDPGAPTQGEPDASALAEVNEVSPEPMLHSAAEITAEEQQVWVNAEMLWSRLSARCGTVSFQPEELIIPGNTVELAGMGDRFNGDAYVTAVRHEIMDGEWRCFLQFGLRRELFADNEGTGNLAQLIPGSTGLHIGTVLGLEGDPNEEARILVHLPVLHPDGMGCWARLATLHAGAEYGMMFIPEIEDEVIVAFAGGDPRSPIILGALHSSAHPRPVQVTDDNEIKGYFAKCGTKITIEESNVITLENPDKHTVKLDGENELMDIQDQHGNHILIDSEGIHMTSVNAVDMNGDGDLTIDFTGNIQISSGGDITLDAAGDLNLTGGGSVTAEGSAGATLTSGGQTEVSGSLVAIN